MSPILPYCGPPRKPTPLHPVRNIRLGENEGFSRNRNDAFVRAAACVYGQMSRYLCRDVAADEGELPRVQFKNIRTAFQGRGSRAAFMRVRPESSSNHAQYVTTVKYAVKAFLS